MYQMAPDGIYQGRIIQYYIHDYIQDLQCWYLEELLLFLNSVNLLIQIKSIDHFKVYHSHVSRCCPIIDYLIYGKDIMKFLTDSEQEMATKPIQMFCHYSQQNNRILYCIEEIWENFLFQQINIQSFRGRSK